MLITGICVFCEKIKTNGKSYTYFSKIKKITATKGKVDRNMFFALLDAPFVWMAQKNTVVPYPCE